MNKFHVMWRRQPAARWGLVLGATTLGLVCSASSQEVFNLQWRESGIHEIASGFRPHTIILSTNLPEHLKQAPARLNAPLYGSFEMGPPKSAARIGVILDTSPDQTQRLFVDSNGNGDFTDDPASTWTNRVYRPPGGQETSAWGGFATVVIPFASGPRSGRIVFYGDVARPAGSVTRPAPQPGEAPLAGAERITTARPTAPPRLFYYGDYGLVGQVTIGGKPLTAALQDAGGAGYFRLTSDMMSTPLIWLDVPGVGRAKGRTFVASRPFEVDGNWWALTNVTPEGAFQIVASAKPLEPAKVATPDLSPGKKAPGFTAKRTDGRIVNFPRDYKGKIVLVDFWATWCGPCVAELPNVVKAYEKYHPQGLEVLGISLDRENWEQKLADFTQERNMPWPQVYDGKFWSAAVAKLYGINAIPHLILVDGDTGVILADKTIRGEQLAPAIEAALAARKK